MQSLPNQQTTSTTTDTYALIYCPVDFDRNGLVNPDDLSDFITCFFRSPSSAQADYNFDGCVDPDDLSDYIVAYFAGC